MANGLPVAPFGLWLKRCRKRRGLTQLELAKRAGDICTDKYISLLERGKESGKKGQPTRPSEEIVEALARALDAPIEDARLAAGYSASRAPSINIAPTIASDNVGAKAEVMRQALFLPRDERI